MIHNSVVGKVASVIALVFICGCSSAASVDINDTGPDESTITPPIVTTASVPTPTIADAVQNSTSSSSTTGVPNNVTTTVKSLVSTTVTPTTTPSMTTPSTTTPPVPQSSTTIPYQVETVEPDQNQNNYETVSPSGT